MSAYLLGGMTLHSFFKFGISSNLNELYELDIKQSRKFNETIKGETRKVSKLDKLQEIIKKLDLIVIDEISMVNASLLDMIENRLRNFGFRGKLLLVGDFYQLPPVNKKVDIFQTYYAFESSSWQSFNPVCIELTKPKRTSDLDFFRFLSNIRVGICMQNEVNFIKSKLINKIEDRNLVLFGTNREADRLNKERLDEIVCKQYDFEAITRIIDPMLNPEHFYRWTNGLMAMKMLELKESAKVIFLKNDTSYFNGEQGIVAGFVFDDGEIQKVIVQKQNGDFVNVERHTYEMIEYVDKKDNKDDEKDEDEEESNNKKVLATLSQFPLRLAYGITIHKSQGMSIDNFTCQIDRIFSPGQLYVALSRATNMENLKICYTSWSAIENHLSKSIIIDPKVDNFYKNSKIIKIEEQ